EGERRHQLYVSPTDSQELRAQLAFRNRLRADPALATEYEALKRELARRFRADRESYTHAKTAFVPAASRPSGPPLAEGGAATSAASPAVATGRAGVAGSVRPPVTSARRVT